MRRLRSRYFREAISDSRREGAEGNRIRMSEDTGEKVLSGVTGEHSICLKFSDSPDILTGS